MPMLDGQLLSQVTYNERMLEDSNKLTAIEANKLGLEAARIANQSAMIDLEAKKAALRNQAAASQMTNEFLAKWGHEPGNS